MHGVLGRLLLVVIRMRPVLHRILLLHLLLLMRRGHLVHDMLLGRRGVLLHLHNLLLLLVGPVHLVVHVLLLIPTARRRVDRLLDHLSRALIARYELFRVVVKISTARNR
jgi:hypothetical protein